jgi:hypothetical protein
MKKKNRWPLSFVNVMNVSLTIRQPIILERVLHRIHFKRSFYFYFQSFTCFTLLRLYFKRRRSNYFSVPFFQDVPNSPHISANQLVFLLIEIDDFVEMGIDARSCLATGFHLLAMLLLKARQIRLRSPLGIVDNMGAIAASVQRCPDHARSTFHRVNARESNDQ